MLKETLELLAKDESASETERAHARRLLSKMPFSDEQLDDCIRQDVDISVKDSKQLFARLARLLKGMPVIFGYDGSWFAYGQKEHVVAICSTLDDASDEIDESMTDAQKIAYCEKCFKEMLADTDIVLKKDVRDLLAKSLGDFEDRSPSIKRLYVRDVRKADRAFSKRHHMNCTKRED